MRVDVLTREYPPDVYGGAGVHVAELVRVLREMPAGSQTAGASTSRDAPGPLDVRVRAFGGARDEAGTTGYADPAELAGANPALRVLGVDLSMVAGIGADTGAHRGPQGDVPCDLVHSHTWYANLAGHVAGLLHGIPHVATAHSLEPLRPWKAEQLGGGYALSSWAERTAFAGAAAVIAVSAGMRRDILRVYPELDPSRVHVVHNGIDSAAWTRDDSPSARETVKALGVDPAAPSVVFVGRITRQKGLPHLLRAVAALPDGVQVVMCAGAPDTPQIAAEVSGLVEGLSRTRSGVVLIEKMLPRDQVVALLSAATVFVCPSVYEPLGIVNLEAMACGAAVVGTATGGIPEVVKDGETGWLVPIDQVQDGTGTPVDPARYEADLAQALITATADPAEARRRGEAGRLLALDQFSWDVVAERTLAVYRQALESPRG